MQLLMQARHAHCLQVVSFVFRAASEVKALPPDQIIPHGAMKRQAASRQSKWRATICLGATRKRLSQANKPTSNVAQSFGVCLCLICSIALQNLHPTTHRCVCVRVKHRFKR